MKLLWITENYPPNKGGMAQSCDRIVATLRKRGVEIDVLHFSNRVKPFAPTQQINGSYCGLPKHADMAHGLNLGLSFLENHCDIESYDAMIAFGGQYPTTAIPIYSKVLQTPYYLCLRGNDFDVSLFDGKRRIVLNEAVQGASGVFVGSRDKQARLKNLYPEGVIHYSPSGIDLSQWRPLDSESQFAKTWRAKEVPKDRSVIGLLGYLKAKKGVQFFLNALILSGEHSNVHLLLSGDLPDSVLTLLSDPEFSYSQIPFVERYDLLKYFLTCDWVAIPSFYDGMPNTMLEAGGLGLPIIASALDGMKDVIRHDKHGVLFRPLDLSDCAQKITYALSITQKQRSAMGLTLQHKISEQFSVSQEAKIYHDVLYAQSAPTHQPMIGVN